jgi:AAA15 family ATPase/GTPase
MSEHFIKEIEIKNYKLFKDFKAEGFGRVNLIGGKNNVGKTAFMEACIVNVYSNDISSMTDVLISPKLAREFLEIGVRFLSQEEQKEFLEFISLYYSISNINKVKFQVLENNGIKQYLFQYKDKEVVVNINEFSYDRKKIDNIRLITKLGYTKIQLKHVFESVQKKDQEEILYKYINDFDKNILNFKIIGGDKPQCKTIDRGYQDINEFGDGLKHYISIICSLYACADGYLFIDEIDNGIHYTQLDKLWEIILKLSKEQNVQVFATTHSKEMIESYARVAKKLEDEEIRFISLYKDNENIKSIVFNNQEIEERLELGLDNR